MEVMNSELRQAVECLHDCRATLRQVVVVAEQFQGGTVWHGIVHVFDVSGHPMATTCYAWSSPFPNSDRRKFYAVLGVPPIGTPADAVRASIANDLRDSKSDA
jgi:hypothetical protein